MVASSIPCKLSLCADLAQARAGGWIASSDIDVADTFTSTHCTIASPQELHGDSWPSSSTGTRSFCCNHQYSVTAITTSTGAVAERYAYTAYGQPTILNASGTPLSPQTSTLNSRYSYTGREWDSTLGLHHFRARWMSPSAGRFLGRDPLGWADGPSLYRSYFSDHGVDPFGTECVGISSSLPGLLGTGEMWNNGPERGQIGVIGYDIDINTRVSGEACTKKCACGNEVIDYKIGIEVTGRAEIFVATYGGSYSDGFIDASYWLGAKGSVGIAGSASLFFYTDNCNCPGKLLGGGCFELGGTVALAIGGEGTFSIKMPWWLQPINPLKNGRISVYGEVRGYATYRKCQICTCNKGCKITNQFCVRGEATVNLSVFGEVRGKLVGYGVTITLWQGETCTNL